MVSPQNLVPSSFWVLLPNSLRLSSGLISSFSTLVLSNLIHTVISAYTPLPPPSRWVLKLYFSTSSLLVPIQDLISNCLLLIAVPYTNSWHLKFMAKPLLSLPAISFLFLLMVLSGTQIQPQGAILKSSLSYDPPKIRNRTTAN